MLLFLYICVMIKVIHKKDSHKYEDVIYVGRGSVLGNPYTSIKNRETLAKFVVDSREESISNFRKYLIEKIKNKDKDICDEMNKIYKKALNGDVYLSCYCSPKSCHGDVIKEIVEFKIDNKGSDESQLSLFSEGN